MREVTETGLLDILAYSSMKVLIVNGFSRTTEGLRAFHRFETAIRNVSDR